MSPIVVREKGKALESGERDPRTGTDDELAEGEESFALFPAVDFQKRIQPDQETKAGFAREFPFELSQRIKCIGNTGEVNFPLIYLKVGKGRDGRNRKNTR